MRTPALAAYARLAASGTVRPPVPIAHLAFDARRRRHDAGQRSLPRAAPDGRPLLARVGRPATRSSSAATTRSSIRRADLRPHRPFSLVVRLQPTEAQDRAVVLHQSRAWTDAGSRGFELTLDRGRPFFGLVHFWPGNAIAVRARQPLPLDAWSQLTVTYDGSSRAAGITLYLNGAPLDDRGRPRPAVQGHHLRARRAATTSPSRAPLTIGARFRDSGFKNGLIDDLQVFDDALDRGGSRAVASASRPRRPPQLSRLLPRSRSSRRRRSAGAALADALRVARERG